LILYVYAIRKKHLKTKGKTLFDLRFFYLSRREREGEQRKKKRQYTHQANSNLPIESIARREKEYCFYKQGKVTSLLQKAIQEIEKRKVRHNTQKIIKI